MWRRGWSRAPYPEEKALLIPYSRSKQRAEKLVLAANATAATEVDQVNHFLLVQKKQLLSTSG